MWAECTKESRLDARVDIGVIKGRNGERKVVVSPDEIEALKHIETFLFQIPVFNDWNANFLLTHKANFRNMTGD